VICLNYRGRNFNNNNYRNDYQGIRSGEESCKNKQKHVHELQGSVKFAVEDGPHNHRFCTVTGEAIPVGNDDHVHEVCFTTDFYDDHFHEFKGKTGCAIPVGNRHVHFIESVTSVDDGHRHDFEAATLIENPIEKEYKSDCIMDDHYDHFHRDRNY
jgi:hypothetical protein